MDTPKPTTQQPRVVPDDFYANLMDDLERDDPRHPIIRSRYYSTSGLDQNGARPGFDYLLPWQKL